MPLSLAPPRSAGRGALPDRSDGDRARGPARRRRLGVLLVLPLLLGLTACTPSAAQEEVRHLVNQERSSRGVHALGDELLVRTKAQDWAEHLAASGRLSHSTLSSGLAGLQWNGLAENVGSAGSISAAHRTFMVSSGHRANILDRRWDVVGVGHAVAADGQHYVVQVFVDLA